jgi:hypothetical protein
MCVERYKTSMFEHPDATISWITYEIEEELARVLVVETQLRLWPTAEGYDEEKVSALAIAAQAFRADRRNGIDKVRIVSRPE